MRLKGQVTAEYLFLLSVVVLLLGVSIYSLSKIKWAEERIYLSEKAVAVAKDIAAAGDEVCALGDGNSRILHVDNVMVSCAGDAVFVSAGAGKAEGKLSYCEVDCAEGEYSGEVSVENVGGRVRLS